MYLKLTVNRVAARICAYDQESGVKLGRITTILTGDYAIGFGRVAAACRELAKQHGAIQRLEVEFADTADTRYPQIAANNLKLWVQQEPSVQAQLAEQLQPHLAPTGATV